jgi:hypothetical protein
MFLDDSICHYSCLAFPVTQISEARWKRLTTLSNATLLAALPLCDGVPVPDSDAVLACVLRGAGA